MTDQLTWTLDGDTWVAPVEEKTPVPGSLTLPDGTGLAATESPADWAGYTFRDAEGDEWLLMTEWTPGEGSSWLLTRGEEPEAEYLRE